MSPNARLTSFLLLMAAAMPAHASEGLWTVAESSGSVSLFVNGRSGPATPGDAVPMDAALLTGQDGRAVLVRGADRVELSANGRIRLRAGESLFTDRGRANFAFGQGPARQAAVDTPYLTARGAGGRFSVTVTAGGATVAPRDGKVNVATIDGSVHQMVEPGMVAIVGADQRDQLMIDGSMRKLIGRTPAPLAAAVPMPDGAVQIAALQ